MPDNDFTLYDGVPDFQQYKWDVQASLLRNAGF
jgi:hypothetical protein